MRELSRGQAEGNQSSSFDKKLGLGSGNDRELVAVNTKRRY